MFAYSEHGEQIEGFIQQLGLYSYNNLGESKRASDIIHSEIQVKFYITIMLLILLGINMFSSLSNVILKREYEIGIKRAVGASKLDIMCQFFFESIFNILLSVWLTSFLFIIYKVWMKYYYDVNWIVNLSKYSIYMFVICSFSMIVIFCIMIAYRATQVEIIQQLKGE